MTFRVGILGGGPSGTACLERLVAHLSVAEGAPVVEIHVFNRSDRFGCGDVYDPAQPEYQLINVSAGDFNIWSRHDPPPVAPDPLPLDAWCRRRAGVPVDPDAHPPRALAGRYLAAAFAAIAAHLPAGVSLHRHVGEVIDLVPVEQRLEVVAVDSNGAPLRLVCDRVLATTGHARRHLSPQERAWRGGSSLPGRGLFMSEVYPTRRLQKIPPVSTVAVRGLALTFVDVVLALTEGRGGVFERRGESSWAYRPSGREPSRILPFSRTGLPASPRSSDITRFRHEPVFFRPDIVQDLVRGVDGARGNGDKIDLDRELWPLFLSEMEGAFYRVKTRGTELEEAAAACKDRRELRALVERFHRRFPEQARFDAGRLLDPFAGRSFVDGAAFQRSIIEHMRRENSKARAGATFDAAKAAVEMWRFCRPALLRAASFGGFTPASQRRFHNEVQPRFHHLVFGPPLRNMEKILALVEHGLLDFAVAPAPTVSICPESGAFRLHCRRTGTERRAEVLLDARVSPFSLNEEASTLYVNLRRRGLVRPFENVSAGEAPFLPGALDLDGRAAQVLTRRGEILPALAVVGAPAYGCHYENTSPVVGERGGMIERWAADVAETLKRRQVPSPA